MRTCFRLELTGRILTETLRLYPPGWMFTRTVTTDTSLADYPIPVGVSQVSWGYGCNEGSSSAAGTPLAPPLTR
ncbi:cytochrome P450 [Streptomyces roseifaciens]|uniref:cytochrome P450 n=1 Tax=Streptomyces roseifaciens TaxID=1488406 RepID=UPI0023B9D55D|nr:cytochrome P450 [Streptomyces roseifaciens]